MKEGKLQVIPLGGLGEFGMNMLALTWGETTIVVDAGVMFPDPELLGVDRIIPDLTYLQQKRRPAALILTHGHEDHIGAVPHVAPTIDRKATIKPDGNSVALDTQMGRLSENAFKIQALTQILSSRYQGLKRVIDGGKG